MALSAAEKKWNKRCRIFSRQDGLCHWCNCEMVLLRTNGGQLPDNTATLDHLDDRFSPDRGKMVTKYRIVLACRKCNHRRGVENQAAQPLHVLHANAQRGRTTGRPFEDLLKGYLDV